MRKTRDTKRRSVYPYVCGGCGNKRIAFDYQRAKAKLCQKCQRNVPDPNQAALPI